MYSSSGKNIYFSFLFFFFCIFLFFIGIQQILLYKTCVFSWYYFIDDSLVSKNFEQYKVDCFLKKMEFLSLVNRYIPPYFQPTTITSESFPVSLLILNRNINIKMLSLLLLFLFFKTSLLKNPWFL